jgi:hypothetical protein
MVRLIRDVPFFRGSDEEWENQRQAVRTALAVALPPNAPAKRAAKTTPATAKKI